MKKKQRYDLVYIIYNDLSVYGRLSLSLLFFIVISAMLVILVTYKTRCVTMHKEQLLIEKDNLCVEWNNLMCKEKVLSNHIRIENIAINQLQMRYFDENIDEILE